MSRFLLLGVTLLQCDASPTGTIVQLFQWRWTDVAMECCAYLGPNGFDAVQISPPMEQITASQWWASYQPVSYNIGNRLGDEAAFTAMVSKCRGCGVSIIADAVTNHMAAGSGTGSSGSSFGGRTFPGTYMARDFHHNDGDEANNCVISNYQDKWNVQHCDLVGLPDLDSGASWPQTRLGAYLGALAELGVAGFRIDAAKHQDAANLGAILTNNASARGKQVYQEVIGAPNEAVQPSEYTSNGLVTEFGFSYAISNAVRNGQLASLRTATDNLLPSASALAFIDNHDSQRSGAVLASSNPKALAHRGIDLNATVRLSSVLTYKEGELYAIGNAFLLAWPYGRVRLMSSYFFDDHDAGAPSQSVHDGDVLRCGTGQPWVCEHRWAAISSMVKWRAVAADADVANWVSDGDGRIAFSRGARAFLALATPSSGNWQSTFQTGLPQGTYCDVAAGAGGFGPQPPVCASNVTVGADGTAQISVGASGVHIVALHVAAMA